jgi:L-lactate dehydrogenase complex protein LldG
MEKAELYEMFQKGLASVAGECCLASKADLAAVLVEIFRKKDTQEVAIVESPLLKDTGVVSALKAAGIKTDTDYIRKNAPDDKGGVTEADYGIANLGSLVQMKDDVDDRIVETVADVYVGIVKLSKIVDTFDTMIDIMAETKPFPKFAGIITGPSRTADIECVGTVGVHGPRQYSVVVVKDA